MENLIPCEECVVTSITRAGRAFLPSRNSILQTGDVLHVSASFDGVEALRDQLRPVGGE
ncbi:MAG: TrkA C-terminal domain-containing protein [Planctomycetes bacterium]|nr:TrkA C-terminal domain-containing protein [Planctomycetota bacterium]